MIIEDKCIERIPLNRKINDNLIYLVDFEIVVYKERIVKKGKYKIKKTSERKIFLEDQLWENNPGEHNKKYFEHSLNTKCEVKDSEKLEIKKVILKKEISCSFYER